MSGAATATAQSEWYSNQSQPQDQSSWRSNFRANDSHQNRSSSSGSSGDLSSSSAERTIRGRIQGFREASVNEGQGQRQEHALVKLRTQDGRTVVADLGPKQDIQDLDLQKGDRLSLRGTQGTVDGQSSSLRAEFELETKPSASRALATPKVANILKTKPAAAPSNPNLSHFVGELRVTR